MDNDNSVSLVNGVARSVSELQASSGKIWPEIEGRLLLLLRALDSETATDKVAVRDAIFEIFEAFPQAYRVLTRATPNSERHEQSLNEYLPKIRINRHLMAPIYYVTDRQLVKKATTDRWFNGRRGDDLSFGIVEIGIPDDHRMGAIEKPRWWRLELGTNPDRHVAICSMHPLEQAAFIERSQRTVDEARVSTAMVFVHGYNVTFANAAKRTAQIAYDLGFKGIPYLYSWPSEGSLSRYITDGENAIWSIPRFQRFLRLLLSDLGLSKVHVIAHSMGSRIVTNGLCYFDISTSGRPVARLCQLVLAAPDIDSAHFRVLAKDFSGRFDRCTLYASSEDLALRASASLARYPRAGQSGADIVITDGVDTIDASLLDTGLASHSYIGDNESILSDLHDLLFNGTPPEGRFRLDRRMRGRDVYWFFRR